MNLVSEMDTEFPFMDMAQYGHPDNDKFDQLQVEVPTSVMQQHHSQHMPVIVSVWNTNSHSRVYISTGNRHFIRFHRYSRQKWQSDRRTDKNTPTRKFNVFAVWRRRECHGGRDVQKQIADTACSKIAAQFPGRSQKSLQVSYCVNFKKRTEKFQEEDVLTLPEC
jgi:hypothetical protein